MAENTPDANPAVALDATAVFTPNDFPTYTYIRRRSEDLEQQLRDALSTPNLVISLSGPSKSGKTVLVQKVVTDEFIIRISGAEIRGTNDLWSIVLDNLDTPASTAEQNTGTTAIQEGQSFTGGITVPVLGVNAGASLSDQVAKTAARARTETRNRGGLQHVQDIIANTDFVMFIDDFHYIDAALQRDIARQIKAASERGIRVAVALVPHRSDDVVRTNAELRGRVQHIDTDFWPLDELKEIGAIGFRQLNIDAADATLLDMAREACGSPQLMQTICLQACYRAGFRSRLDVRQTLRYDTEFKRDILEQSASTTDYSALVTAMHRGAIRRGAQRSEFQFHDGSTGDMYRAVLLAISQPPPRLDIGYTDLMTRVQRICRNTSPPSSSVRQACNQIATIARTRYPDQFILEWENDTLNIVDPYFLFYLRASRKLAQLGQTNGGY